MANLAANYVTSQTASGTPSGLGPFLKRSVSVNPGLSYEAEEAFQVPPSVALSETAVELVMGRQKVVVPTQPVVSSSPSEREKEVWIAYTDLSHYGGGLLHSTDGGRTWAHVLTTHNAAIDGVYFQPRSGIGFSWGLAGSSAAVWETFDGGRSWRHVPLNVVSGASISDVGDIAFASSDVGWMVGYDTQLRPATYTTQDGGQSWSEQVLSCGAQCMPNWAEPVSLSSAWVSTVSANWSGRLLRTSDGGTAWRVAGDDPSHGFEQVVFSGPRLGWAVGASYETHTGALWSTSDGGLTWESQPYPIPLLGVTSDGSNAVWAVGGHIATTTTPRVVSLRTDRVVLFSSDGGLKWRPLWDNRSVALYMASFVGPEDGWAIGMDSKGDSVVESTSDGGARWRQDLRLPGVQVQWITAAL